MLIGRNIITYFNPDLFSKNIRWFQGLTLAPELPGPGAAPFDISDNIGFGNVFRKNIFLVTFSQKTQISGREAILYQFLTLKFPKIFLVTFSKKLRLVVEKWFDTINPKIPKKYFFGHVSGKKKKRNINNFTLLQNNSNEVPFFPPSFPGTCFCFSLFAIESKKRLLAEESHEPKKMFVAFTQWPTRSN